MASIGEIKAQLGEADEEAKRCKAAMAQALGHVEMACGILEAVLVGSYHEQVLDAWKALIAIQEKLGDADGQVRAAQAGAQTYVAYLDSGNAGGGGPPPSASPAGRSPARSSGGSALRRMRKFAATDFGNHHAAAGHLRRHGRDFHARTVGEYVESASDFLRRAQEDDYPARVDRSGRIRIYDPATNVFGAFDPDGTVVTYYKPSSGYWQRNEPKWGDPVFWE